MAEDSKEQIPRREPGVLCGIETAKRPKIDLTPEEQEAFKQLNRKINQRDSAAYRELVIRVWERRLFDRGFQHLFPTRQGWSLTSPYVGTQGTAEAAQQRSMFITNAYNSYMQIIASALSREVPRPRFEPDDPENAVDITAARCAEKLKDVIERNNDILTLLADEARMLWNDPYTVKFTRFIIDGQRFGYQPEPEGAVPEDAEQIAQQEMADNANAPGDSSPVSAGGEATQEATESRGTPNGQEVIELDGALEWKFPIKANSRAECGWARRRKEIDIATAKARYPDVADELKADTGGSTDDDIDRLARINVMLGIQSNYITSDSEQYDVTEQKTFYRPEMLLEIPEKDREAIIAKFPLGAYVTFCGDTFCEARNETMDDYISITYGMPGDGMARNSMGASTLPLQKIVNKWSELEDDYFIRGVPRTWMDNEMFNVQALKDQSNIPGGVSPFDREPGVTMDQVIWQEPKIEPPTTLAEEIDQKLNAVMQLMSAAVPALFGGDSGSEGVADALMQRDQALGRIGMCWRNFKKSYAETFRQAVQSIAQNQKQNIRTGGKEAITIEIEDLKGNIKASPETDENFPSTYTQRSNRMMQLIEGAAANPLIAQFLAPLLDTPDNIEELSALIGLEKLVWPTLESHEKQLGEIKVMLEAGPVPNPQIDQAQELEMELATRLAAGDATVQPQIMQLQQEMQQLPPEVSSYPVDPDDDHVTEEQTCLRFMRSARGRALKNGNPQEQAAFQNIRLHKNEHQQYREQAEEKAKQQNQPPPKPVSVSLSGKDMPPLTAASAAAKAGLEGTPEEFVAHEATKAAETHPGPGGISIKAGPQGNGKK